MKIKTASMEDCLYYLSSSCNVWEPNYNDGQNTKIPALWMDLVYISIQECQWFHENKLTVLNLDEITYIWSLKHYEKFQRLHRYNFWGYQNCLIYNGSHDIWSQHHQFEMKNETNLGTYYWLHSKYKKHTVF